MPLPALLLATIVATAPVRTSTSGTTSTSATHSTSVLRCLILVCAYIGLAVSHTHSWRLRELIPAGRFKVVVGLKAYWVAYLPHVSKSVVVRWGSIPEGLSTKLSTRLLWVVLLERLGLHVRQDSLPMHTLVRTRATAVISFGVSHVGHVGVGRNGSIALYVREWLVLLLWEHLAVRKVVHGGHAHHTMVAVREAGPHLKRIGNASLALRGPAIPMVGVHLGWVRVWQRSKPYARGLPNASAQRGQIRRECLLVNIAT
mmetsp:Transcript_1756/g.6205  ORF Transcript_1756/g.6205 Transcript_1756/m.6205 type:complete len:258 (-) Transcript_1756:2324-3097(-)